jgi:hypothetical protein
MHISLHDCEAVAYAVLPSWALEELHSILPKRRSGWCLGCLAGFEMHNGIIQANHILPLQPLIS